MQIGSFRFHPVDHNKKIGLYHMAHDQTTYLFIVDLIPIKLRGLLNNVQKLTI